MVSSQVATRKKNKKQQLTCAAASASHCSKKNKKEQSACGKEKEERINCPDQKIKWMLHAREEMQSLVKNNGQLLGGNLEENQKATISLCGRQCKPLQKMSKKEQSTCQKEKTINHPDQKIKWMLHAREEMGECDHQ